MADKHGKPPPEWRIRVRRRFEEKGIDFEDFDRRRKRAAVRASIVCLVLIVAAFLIRSNEQFIVRIVRTLGHR